MNRFTAIRGEFVTENYQNWSRMSEIVRHFVLLDNISNPTIPIKFQWPEKEHLDEEGIEEEEKG